MIFVNEDLRIRLYHTSSTYYFYKQVEGLRHNVPEIVGVTMASIVIIIILLGIVYGIKRRTYNIKSQRNSIDVSNITIYL